MFAGSNSTAQPHFVGFGSGDGSLTVTASYGDWIRLVPTVGEPLVLTVGDLGLASDPNLRDVGGYRTTDGRWVWMGVVYRSQALALSPADLAVVDNLGITADYNLRTTLLTLLTLLGVPRDTVVQDYLLSTSTPRPCRPN